MIIFVYILLIEARVLKLEQNVSLALAAGARSVAVANFTALHAAFLEHNDVATMTSNM